MNQHVRELLVTSKEAQHWDKNFSQEVESLMALVNRIDNEVNISRAAETVNVYRKTVCKTDTLQSGKSLDCGDRPFEFLIFRN